MKKLLSLLFAVLTISLTASAQDQATVRLLVPSDCDMNISNGMWLAWFNGYDDYSSNINIVPMTPEAGGRIFIASFTPEQDSYFGYFFLNAASMEGQYQRTYTQTYQSERDTVCYEIIGGGDYYYFSLNRIYDCVMADHNYKPYNLSATPLGRDSVLFEWSVADGEYYGFYISAYKQDGSSFETYVEADKRSLRAKLNVAEQTVFDRWELSANVSSGVYTTAGKGFTVDGDDRIPRNLTVTSDGNRQYTIRWDAGNEVDHFYVVVDSHDPFDNITARSLQVTLEDNNAYYIYVSSRDAQNNDLGSTSMYVSTTTQEARDLKLHFYIPDARGFVGETGAAILWRDADFAGDHIVPLVAEEDAPHWYVATVAAFNRSYILYNLINATTAESATMTIDGGSFGQYSGTETYLILGVREDNGELYLDDYASSYYPHDYAARNLQLKQVMNKLVFTWESTEEIQYRIHAYDTVGNIVVDGYTYSDDGNIFEFRSDNDKPYVIARWVVTPYVYWSTISTMRVEDTTPFTVQPSPFSPKNLKAQDNGDGTWTFSWDPIQLDTVEQYSIEVRDAGGSYALSRYNLRETSITEQVNFMFSGRCSMRVNAQNNWGSQLGTAVDSFTVAPLPAHDINIRILVNPLSGYDTIGGVQFDIQSSAKGGFETVNATDDKYGWWKYSLNTTERGAIVRLYDTWRTFNVYGDTCVAYTGSYEEEDCDAHADDYMPQNLLAQDNGDGTWTLSWSMDYTERVYYYHVNVNDSNGSYICGQDVRKALQWKTPVIAATGRYTYSVGVYNNNGSRIGYKDSTFTVEPKVERDIVLSLLVQPGAQDGWAAYTYNAETYEWDLPVEFTPAAGGWLTHTFTTTDPAVNVRFKQNAYYYYGTDITVADNTCVEYDGGEFKVVDCDKAKLQNYTVSNAKVVNLGEGKFKFTWDCEDNPYQFHVRACMADSSTIVWSTNVNGDEHEFSTRLNNDSTMEIVWYVVPIKRIDYSNTYLWDCRAFGPNFTAVASAYIPQNLKTKANADGTWTISWDAQPAPVYRHQVVVYTPNGYSNYYYPAAGDTAYTTDKLSQVGKYTVYVYAQNNSYETLGQASTTFTVSEVAERALTVRLLLHPDAGRSIEQMYCQASNSSWIFVDPVDEGNCWYSFTFNSTMPAPDVQIFGYQPTIFADTCLQYYGGNLTGAACNATPVDNRIIATSLKAVSEPGRVVFSWSPQADKANYYELQFKVYNEQYGYWETFDWRQVADTCCTYIVPDNRDGQVIRWSVGPSSPHYLNPIEAAEPVTLHKSEIVLNNLKSATTDSVHYHLSWTCNNTAVQFRLQVRINGNGYINTVLTDNQYDITALTSYGSYDWQVCAVDAKGEQLTPWSQSSFTGKSGLRVLSNLKGSADNRTLRFTWNTSAPRVVAQLWRETNAWSREPMLPNGDTILTANEFEFLALEDGRYLFEVYALVEASDGSSIEIYEDNHVNVNLFKDVETYHVNISTTVGGSFYGVDPSGDYPAGYRLRVCPSSVGDYRFVRWSDGAEDECRTLTIKQDTTLIALYEPVPESHIIIAAENGLLRKVYSEDTIARIDTVVRWGFNIYIEAIPNADCELYEWSDGYDREQRYRYLSLDSDTSIIAVFKPYCYVSVAAGEGGRVQISGYNEYNKANKVYRCSWGSEITVKANPNEGYRFKRWSDGDTNVSRTITVTGELNLTAVFEPVGAPLEKYVVRILSSDTELGEVNQVSGNYFDGDKLTIIATPKEHARFITWSDGVAEPTRVITVTADTTITAQFEYKRVTLTISASEGGSVNSEVNGTYNYGTELTITATPAEHYHFVSWSDGETSAVRNIRLTDDLTLIAEFAVQTYLVTFLNADGSYIESNNWKYGDTPACSVIPTMDPTQEWIFTFAGWTPAITAVTGNAVYTAVYDKEPNPGQGIDETPAENEYVSTARKVLINGQFYILRDNRIYTMQGQLVK